MNFHAPQDNRLTRIDVAYRRYREEWLQKVRMSQQRESKGVISFRRIQIRGNTDENSTNSKDNRRDEVALGPEEHEVRGGCLSCTMTKLKSFTSGLWLIQEYHKFLGNMMIILRSPICQDFAQLIMLDVWHGCVTYQDSQRPRSFGKRGRKYSLIYAPSTHRNDQSGISSSLNVGKFVQCSSTFWYSLIMFTGITSDMVSPICKRMFHMP